MNIVICPDKFKGSLNAKEVCNAVSAGLRAVYPDARIESVPLADGGEGTCALLTEWHQGHNIDIEVHGPLFTPVKARYGLSKEGDKAFIEMAQASGLTLIEPEERNALMTTTLGTGEMIADA
ncbi:MAG TPA: glycerate kinase, partial [Chryseosolibacter sp.]